MWEQRESNPRPSACKADALNQLSYAPFFRFLWLITASDFVSSLLTTSRLLRRSSLVFLVLNQNKLQNSFVSFSVLQRQTSCPHSSQPAGCCVVRHSSSLHCGKTNFKKILSEIPSVKELAFGEVFSEKDCKDTQEILFCKFL